MSGERKLVNLSNEKGVSIDHSLMEKSKKRSGGVQDSILFSFSFEGSGMKVKRREEKKRKIKVIKTNKKSAKTTQARRESEGGKLVV